MVRVVELVSIVLIGNVNPNEVELILAHTPADPLYVRDNPPQSEFIINAPIGY